MPNGDGTGPMGTGGWCTPLWESGQMPRPMGRGFFRRGMGNGGGFGRGAGRGYGFRQTGFFQQQNFTGQPINEKAYLEQRLNALEQEEKNLLAEKEEIKKRIEQAKQ
ncbi:MAG: DUF5320 domain-containing protein [archaeon]